MAKLSEEAKKIIDEVHPGFIATTDKDGKPNVSPKGSFRVLDDEHVAFNDVSSPRTIANLKDNPQLSAIVFDPATRKGCRIWGTAEILDSGELFDSISADFADRGRKLNNVVKITVEQAATF
ncbi:pyridoxamine 5'-phosphate oxidase family protein [Chloroflexota bacterium]